MSANQEYEMMVLEPGRGCYEATLLALDEQRVALFFNNERQELCTKMSTDRGRSWGEPTILRTADGEPLHGYRTHPLRLKSGKLGLAHTAVPHAREGRDGPLMFHVSEDEGETWSDGVWIDPRFAVARNGTSRVLSSGRIVVPVFMWISPLPGGEAESQGRSLCYSWVYYSDDEGESWQASESELVVMTSPYNAHGVYDFEEPCIEELNDGRLLMHGRTRLGRIYDSHSSDEGKTWTTPQPTELASAYTPPHLSRIPTTGDLLAIWNQISPEEIYAGLQRHRLSCAISRDEGSSWSNFKNLESLNDVTYIEPPPFKVYDMEIEGIPYRYNQPQDHERYPHAPGVLRICYPNVAFMGDEALIVYDYGMGTMKGHGTKLRIVPIDWFYE